MSAETLARTPETASLSEEAELIKDIVINSFRFSRGVGPTQQHILSYLAQDLYGKLDEAAFADALQPTIEAAVQIYSHSPVHKGNYPELPAAVYGKVERESSKYFYPFRDQVLGGKSESDTDQLIESLIASDAKWCLSKVRPFTSNLVKFALLEKETGMQVYDDMFAVVGHKLPKNVALAHRSRLEELKVIVDSHLKTRPQDKEPLELYMRYGALADYQFLPRF